MPTDSSKFRTIKGAQGLGSAATVIRKGSSLDRLAERSETSSAAKGDSPERAKMHGARMAGIEARDQAEMAKRKRKGGPFSLPRK